MLFKSGVVMWQMDSRLEAALEVVDQVHHQVADRDAVITCGRDGSHMRGSLHYVGRAVDLRTTDLDVPTRNHLVAELQQKLGADFDVVLEVDHLHLELDPKGAAHV